MHSAAPPPIRRALLSVYDKTGIVDFAWALSERGVEIISTGGTARTLVDAGLPVREVSDVTGFPEMLDGRVKTLHPLVHGGLLARRDDADHMKQAQAHGIGMIDLLVVNLYPFEKTLADRPDDAAGIIEMIDIGGPAMVRSASKNAAHVTVVVDPADYATVLSELTAAGGVSTATRTKLAAKAFSHTSAYDALIADFLNRLGSDAPETFPPLLTLPLRRRLDLRYGENPHQAAALYADPLDKQKGAAAAEMLHGKELSFNNILDLDAAWSLVCDLPDPACAVIKHNTPCGAAADPNLAMALKLAFAGDPMSAFGGIVALNREVTAAAAAEAGSIFLEAIIAPDFHPAALSILKQRKNLRILRAGAVTPVRGGFDCKRVAGGMLVQERDDMGEDFRDLKVVTRRPPTDAEMRSLRFAWTIVRHVKSNAIVYAVGTVTAGIGAGQMSRVDAVRFGALKAVGSLDGSVLASDAFFPFRDGVDEAARSGVRAIIQPGGSKKDDEVIAAADEHGIAMVLTGRRHFRH